MFEKVLVVGAGLAGSVCARKLAEAGEKVLVVERLNHIGGHCYDFKNNAGITVHRYGPHIFHTESKRVWDFVTGFSDFHYYQHRVLAYAEGAFHKFPINLDTINGIYGTALNINEVEGFLSNEVESSNYQDPVENFEDAVIAQVGKKMYEMFFRNYTIKQWERDPRELSPELAKRIPVRKNRDARYFSDPYQGIPEKGYTALISAILDHENISVLLNTDYCSIKDSINARMTVYTGELDRFFDYRHGKLAYRSLDLAFKTFDKAYYQDVATVNYPNDYDWTRITEFKHFLDEQSDKTTVCFEYPRADGEPYYIVMNAENMKKREEYMEEAERLEHSGRYLFVGRLAEYQYYNMDQVILRALEKMDDYFK